MIKVFTLNKNGKIELTKKELEQLLNESYWEGHRKNNYWTYISPSPPPFCSYRDWYSNTATNMIHSISELSSDPIIIKTNLGE